jgi:enterochelin esterase-like enzyme
MTLEPKAFEQQLLHLGNYGDTTERAQKARELYETLKQHDMLPLVVESRAYFIFLGTAERIALAGDWTHWQIASQLKRVEGTDLFHRALEFPRTARLQYKFLVDGDFVTDPGNNRYSREGFGVNSEFWMSEYTDNSWLQAPSDGIERGTVERFELHSATLDQRRQVFLYTPAGAYNETEPLPLLIVHDGAEALEIGRFHHILDHLIAAGRIRRCAALFIPPGNRHDEYALNMRYVRFTVRDALPYALNVWKERGVRISSAAQDRCVLGASLGGLLASMTALRYPLVVGSCISQSPAYWWARGEIFRTPYFRNASKLRVILQTGTICDARELTRIMYQKLKLAGAEVIYHEYEQGHTWGNWRTNLATALLGWIGRVPNGETASGDATAVATRAA